MLHIGKLAASTVLFVAAAIAFAEAPRRVDLSKAWFKPELVLNAQPEVCKPIFARYADYFASGEAKDPLQPISDRAWEEHKPGTLTEAIRELEWAPLGQENSGLRLAQWRQGGRYFGLLERGEAIGWRPPFFRYSLIDKPISGSDPEGRAKRAFDEGSIAYLKETSKPGLFDVVYESQARHGDFSRALSVQVANLFSARQDVYLALTASSDDPGPRTYLVVRVMTPRQLQAVCRMTILPSPQAIAAELAKVPHYKDFEAVVQDMMGGAGDCGTLNSHGRAMNQLSEGLATLAYRPWSHASTTAFYDLSGWGYSGPWNYRKYLHFLAVLPRIQQSLADKYVKDYRFDTKQAAAIAEAAIQSVLAQAFNHGRIEDADREWYQALLEGRSVQDLSFVPAPQATTEESREPNPLVFAIGHPHLVEYLLKRGTDPNRINAFGKSALMYAAQFNDLASAKLLAKHGANTELATTRPQDNCSYTISTHRVTALHYAVRYASGEFIEWLVKFGAVTSAKDSNGNTPLDYLTKFGGTAEDGRAAALSYGQQNALLKKKDVQSLTALLTPPDARSGQLASDEANRSAESLYRSGNLKGAYLAVKKSLSLNPANERAMANLSLIALRLGHNGESAKAATYVVESADSKTERASALFNLGLACRAEGNKGYHYSTIYYDGAAYCQERSDRYHGPLYYYLKAHETAPSARRANAIVEFLQESDTQRGKWLCKARDSNSDPSVVYVARNYIYFLTKNGAQISFPRFAIRDRNKDDALEVKQKEEYALGNGLSVQRWEVYVPHQGTLVLGAKLCSRFLPVMIEDGMELIEVHTRGKAEQVTLSSRTSKPVVLLLYGNDASWTVTNDSKNIGAAYVYGKDAGLKHPEGMRIPLHMDTKRHVYPEPWGSSFNTYTTTTLGLSISAIVDSSGRQRVELEDSVIAAFPRCEGRVRTNCRTP